MLRSPMNDSLEQGIGTAEHTHRMPRKRAAVTVVFTDGRGRVLLCEPTYKRVWEAPGGTSEAEELLAAAVGVLGAHGDTPQLRRAGLDVFTLSCDRTLGDYGAALHRASTVDVEAIPDANERGRYWQNVGIAAFGRGRFDLAVEAVAETTKPRRSTSSTGRGRANRWRTCSTPSPAVTRRCPGWEGASGGEGRSPDRRWSPQAVGQEAVEVGEQIEQPVQHLNVQMPEPDQVAPPAVQDEHGALETVRGSQPGHGVVREHRFSEARVRGACREALAESAVGELDGPELGPARPVPDGP
jgi:hypothetical protein